MQKYNEQRLKFFFEFVDFVQDNMPSKNGKKITYYPGIKVEEKVLDKFDIYIHNIYKKNSQNINNFWDPQLSEK